MATTTPRLEHWTSAEGHAALERVAKQPGSLPALARSLGLVFWERAVLRRALSARRSLLRQRRGKQVEAGVWAERLARELDYIRAEEQRLARSHPFPRQRSFKGNRDHLALLERSIHVPIHESEWNEWRARARRIRPDLRGANLADQRLNELDLSHARLEGAELSRAWLFNAPHADLRRSRLIGSHLGGAALRKANLTEALLRNTNLTEADLSGAILRGANLISCTLNRASLEGADLRGALVWGASVWDTVYDATTKQTGLYLAWEGVDPYDDYDWQAMRRSGHSMRVDNLELAHFMALVRRRRESLGELFKEASAKIVLLLGRFTGKHGQALLTLEEALEPLGYLPVRFDFERARDRDTIETIATLAGLSRFIVADFSEARSAPLEAQRIIPDFAVPFVPIRHRDADAISMFEALQKKYAWVLPTFVYSDQAHLRRSLKRKIVGPAERESDRLRRIKG